ncbi:MAG: PDZ domain-containing protein [Phycisphaerales bacterium]|nr:PDZ domain-containing protein [Phycisphaerales bacterium]MCI0631644.1 PDZ domain-containing protein [Phycisphaerales bacterium]MCI0677160.1 PDZ domain-containing protein [Phycisphaerales bacterium]
MRLVPTTLITCTALTLNTVAQEKPAAEKAAPADLIAIAETVLPSLARVEYTLQYDKSQEPYGAGWKSRCPSCGQYHASETDGVIADERPVETAGYVLSPTLVLTSDPLMHERFIKETIVRFGDFVSPAKPSAYCLNGNLMFLELEIPIAQAKPLKFDASRSGPYYTVNYTQANGTWSVGVGSMPTTVTVGQDGRRYIAGESGALIVDGRGAAIGICQNDELPLDDSWKGAPSTWPQIDGPTLERMLGDFEAASSHALPRAHLYFRSPKSNLSPYNYRSDEDSSTEWYGTGALLDESTILILANLKPDATARLERIRVHGPEGEAVSATFSATLKDYGAFLAKLDQPLSRPAKHSTASITDYRHALLLGAEVEVQGESRVAYYTHTRIPGFEVGWRRQIYPIATVENQFLFDREGALVAIPMMRRTKVTVEREWHNDSAELIPANHIRDLMAKLPDHIDATNVPLSEEEENRLAWMGVELQDLDAELARVNNVSALTRDGNIGALVTWVYEGSPAAQAGLEVGDILLRLHVAGHPKPLDVETGEEDMFGAGGFPWDRLDEVPEEYFDRIPKPWPPADNDLNQKLTRLGFGTAYSAELVRSGKPMSLNFTVVQSPAYYDSAPKHKSEELGLTVHDLTYEVRRYLQRKPDDPGVIIARIERGSRSSISGAKPYEVITHINDQPLMNVADFAQAIKAGGELRLSVKRMTRGRIVKINVDGPPPEAPAEAGAVEGEIGVDDEPTIEEDTED